MIVITFNILNDRIFMTSPIGSSSPVNKQKSDIDINQETLEKLQGRSVCKLSPLYHPIQLSAITIMGTGLYTIIKAHQPVPSAMVAIAAGFLVGESADVMWEDYKKCQEINNKIINEFKKAQKLIEENNKK